MCGFWSICRFSLKTHYRQHNLQSLCNKSFCPSIASSGRVVLVPEGAREVISQPVPGSSPELRPAHESQRGHGGLQRAGSAVQPRAPGAALGHQRGARSVRGAAPRRGPRLPRGSTTLTAAGGVGGPGAVGSGRGKISQRETRGKGRESKAKVRARRLMRKDKEKGHSWKVNTGGKRHASAGAHDGAAK